MMRKSLALLLLGTASAQQGAPSIEDMLRDSSHVMDTPAPSLSQDSANSISSGLASSSDSAASDVSSLGSPPAVSPSGSIGGILGAIAASSGDKVSDKPDMFGRKPVSSGQAMAGLLGGGGGGSGGADGSSAAPMNPVMGALLDSVEAKMPMQQKLAAKNGGAPAPGSALGAISQESKDIVAGIVEAFMHKVALLPGEKSCLENNLATLTFDVVGTVTDIVKGVKAIIANKEQVAIGNTSAKSQSQGSMISAGLDGSMKITSLVTMATSLLKNCVQGDALAMLQTTGRHFVNMQYVGHRLLVSGVDIAHRLSDAIIAYESKDYHRFGADIGIAIRKILLSNATSGARLPEGVPEQSIIEETTAGLMDGFFISGSGVEITDVAAPDVDIQLDLHRCIAGNHEFFKEIWLAMWNLFAQLSTSAMDGADIDAMFDSTGSSGEQPKWMGELMIAMMQVPVALSRCNIGEHSQQMMMEAVKSIKFVQVHFLFPKQNMVSADEATQRMAKAVNAWTQWNFQGFGRQIGQLLRIFVLLMYPQGGATGYAQQYSVDVNGRLRRELVSDVLARNHALKLGAQTFSPTCVAFGVAVSMLVSIVAVRGIRSMSRKAPFTDCEGASDCEMAGDLLEVE
jgi:hypothetical protein